MLTTQAPGNQWTTNSWDGENRLTRVALPSGIVDSFTYNGDGQRVQKQDSTGTTSHVWDGENIISETNASNIIQVVYTLDPLFYGNLISQSRSGADSFYLFDALGSVTQLTSIAGAVSDSYIYSSFGYILAATGTTVSPFRYKGSVGYYLDSDLAWYYVRARVYDPSSGRFLSTDPLRETSPGSHPFVYADNNPVNTADPSGLIGIRYTGPANLTLGKCGDASMAVGFQLLPANQNASGLIVQKVNRQYGVWDCEGNPAADPIFDEYPEYFEAWTVNKGTVSPSAGNVNDTFKTCPMPGTCGYYAIQGQIVFWENKKLKIHRGRGQLKGDEWLPGRPAGASFDPCDPTLKGSPSGILPWRRTAPAGWQNQVNSGSTGHSLKVHWCCCDQLTGCVIPHPCAGYAPCKADSPTKVDTCVPAPPSSN